MFNWKILTRSVSSAFNVKKLFFLFPLSMLCSYLMGLGIKLLIQSSNFFMMSLAFFPILGSGILFLYMGIFLVHTHKHPENKSPNSYWKALFISLKTLGKSSYLILPLILILLAKKVIAISFFGSLWFFQNAVFLKHIKELLMSSLPIFVIGWITIFSIFSLFLLFLITPSLIYKEDPPMQLIKNAYKQVKENPSFNFTAFAFSSVPIVIMTVVFFLNSYFAWSINNAYLAFLLTPTLSIFFNFSSEHFFLKSQ
jgi:hypothetical protein